MNNIRAIEALNQRELEAGVPLSASWHTDWADTAYVYIGGLPYELSEGDIITIFSQFGEPVHVNLIRDKDTGKSKGFAFLKYEDQRSTNLAVDNLGGATVLGRIIRVDHTRYKPKEGDVVDEDAHMNSGKKVEDKSDDEARHGRKRRRGNDTRDDNRRKKTPLREMLKEELELQRLIQEHDEEDPMKEYLIRQKKEDVKQALKKLRNGKKSPRHRHYSGRDDKNEYKHRSQRHRSRSRNPSRQSRSINHQHSTKSPQETDRSREKGKDVNRERISERDRATDKEWRRVKGNDGEGGSGRGQDERRERGRERGRVSEREREQGRDVNGEKGRNHHKDRGRIEVAWKTKHEDDI